MIARGATATPPYSNLDEPIASDDPNEDSGADVIPSKRPASANGSILAGAGAGSGGAGGAGGGGGAAASVTGVGASISIVDGVATAIAPVSAPQDPMSNRSISGAGAATAGAGAEMGAATGVAAGIG